MFIRVKSWRGGEELIPVADIARIADSDAATKFHGIYSIIYFKDGRVFESNESFASLVDRMAGKGAC